MFAPPEFTMEHIHRTSQHMAFQLHDASIKGGSAGHGFKEAECAFASDVRGFYSRPILQYREQRKNGALREIDMLQSAGGVANDSAEFDRDRLKMSIQTPAKGRLQRAQQLIAQSRSLRRFRHAT